MSPRWQPPHPDPSRIQATPYSQRMRDQREHIAADGKELGARCIWPRCREYADPWYDVRMCIRHTLHVHAVVQKHIDDRTAIHSSREADRIDDTIKIGYASDVSSRMRHYPPTAKLLAVEPGTKKTERERHDHFHAYLAHGREWFRPCEELDTWINTIITEYGAPTAHEYRYTTPQTSKQTIVPRRYKGVKRTAA